MTERELRRLSRTDLLELLLTQSRQIDALQEELALAKQALEDKNIAIRKSGSIAEAALQLSGIFEAAQKACDQYTLNMEAMVKRQELLCAKMERETREKCNRMLRDAKQSPRQEQEDPEWLRQLLETNKEAGK